MNISIEENSNKKEEKNMKIIGTYVDQSIYQNLQEEADDSFTSVSSIVRKIIYQYIKNKNK